MREARMKDQGLGMRALYLHGFASSPDSSKATFLTRKLRACGIEADVPDLNLPEFSTLTVTRMLGQTDALIAASRDPMVLIGSSLGGFVAVNAAVRWPERIHRVVLLAPALAFADERMRVFGTSTVDDWKRAGTLDVFHYAYGRMMPVHYELYADAARYDALHARPSMPVLVFQGRRDTVVDPESVRAWCAARANVELHMLDDDHQLTASLPDIWNHVAEFVRLRS
jgi:pimeloyl-ACP methyl ester carboxylesterase